MHALAVGDVVATMVKHPAFVMQAFASGLRASTHSHPVRVVHTQLRALFRTRTFQSCMRK